MPAPTNQGSLLRAESNDPPQPIEPPIEEALAETATVLNLTSLLSVAQRPAQISNLRYATSVASTNLAAQNGVANQQSMNQLGTSVLGRVVQAVSNLGPLEARSSVDVLTDNDLADAITSLKATMAAFSPNTPIPVGPPGKLLYKLVSELIRILKAATQKEELKGNGTMNDPYVTDGILYFQAPITIGFYRLLPDPVSLQLQGQRVVATSSLS